MGMGMGRGWGWGWGWAQPQPLPIPIPIHTYPPPLNIPLHHLSLYNIKGTISFYPRLELKFRMELRSDILKHILYLEIQNAYIHKMPIPT